jgi:hypothetical protein
MVDTGPSRRLWRDCPWDSIQNGSVRGTAFFDDFDNVSALLDDYYEKFVDAGCTITQLADKSFGEIQLLLDGNTEEDDCVIQTGGNTGGLARFIDPANLPAGITTTHDVWFEARIKVSSISASTGSVFVGLMAENAAGANGVISTADVVADKDCIGFAILNSAPSVLQFTFKRAGQTVQVPIATVHTLVADTYVTVGFNYVSGNPTARRIMVFKNNVANATGVTKANIEAVTFPDGDSLSLTAGLTSPPTPAAKNLIMDWWRVATVEN